MDKTLLTIVVFLAFIFLFTIAVRYGTLLAGRIVGQKVSATHHMLEAILDTEKIPPEWLDPAPREPAQVAAWQARQRDRAIEKLKTLHKYAENSPAFEDRESREYVLLELERIQEQWATRPFAEIAGTSASPPSQP